MTGAFRFVSRKEWGARPFRGLASPLGTPREIILHHSVIAGGAREIQRFHQDIRGWQDIGYHYVIDRWKEGYAVFEGRPIEFCGAHAGRRTVGSRTTNRNFRRIGICVAGDFRFAAADEELERTIEALVHALIGAYPTLRRLRGHHLGDHALTPGGGECPGPRLVPWLERWQRAFPWANASGRRDLPSSLRPSVTR